MPRDIAWRKTAPQHDLGWQDHAACQGQPIDMFFAPDNELKRERERREATAKTFCDVCPVIGECFDYAVGRPEKYGTWGGMDPDGLASERRNRPRRKGARQPEEDAA